MAKATLQVLNALRNTVKRIETSNDYQWGHMGSCNCGFLAQEITALRKDEIHWHAMQRYGDWNDQLNDYCPTSGLLMDDIITKMLGAGFDADDLKHLERLSDPRILALLPAGQRNLLHNSKSHVLKYLRAWMALIEGELIDAIGLSDIEAPQDLQPASTQ